MIIKALCLVTSALLLSSCAPSRENTDTNLRDDDASMVEEQAASPEVDVRQPVYVYNQQSHNDAQEITLQLNSEPLLLHNSYVRLVGVVSGGRPMALVEVGGRGVSLGAGGEVCGYRVVSIFNDEIKLEREAGK